ncbi:MAG: RNA-directed DNA polymerase [Gemmataceae bacterium]|nr:RNA-directed DNA polymerase [Gemmataceae bacterium]
MKRTGRLFDLIVERGNLRLALHKALRGKRHGAEPRAFCERLEEELASMAAGLRDGTFPVGRFRQFVIRDPKERVITAPCFAERVMHHAVMNVCEPHLDRRLVFDSYACRKGKGRLKALARMQEHARRYGFFLKLDVRKYFDSIPHGPLLALLERRFKDARLLALFGRIVRSFRAGLGTGLPIGALTSQHLANAYLNGFDRLMKDALRIGGYVRCMDDIILWDDDKAKLKAALAEGVAQLAGRGLEPKTTPYLNRTSHGLEALGCRVFPTHAILGRRARVRFRRKLAALEAAGLPEDGMQRRAMALLAFTRTPGLRSFRFRRAVLESLAEGGRRAPAG